MEVALVRCRERTPMRYDNDGSDEAAERRENDRFPSVCTCARVAALQAS